MPVLNSSTYEMTCGNEQIKNQKIKYSNKSKLEQCKQRQFSQDKHVQLANIDKENCKDGKYARKPLQQLVHVNAYNLLFRGRLQFKLIML